MVVSSSDFCDGDSLDTVTGDKDRDLLLAAKQIRQEFLPNADRSACHNAAGLWLFADADFQIMRHFFSSFPRSQFFVLLDIRRKEGCFDGVFSENILETLF